MSTNFEGTLFDAETLRPHAIALEVTGNRLRSLTEGIALDVDLAEVRTSDRLASLPRFLYLPGNRTVETPHNDAIDFILAGQKRGRMAALIHWLEAKARVAAAATLLLVALVSATLWLGLPIFVRKAAMAVPPEVEKRIGQTSLVAINRILGPSQLRRSDQKRAQAQLDRLIKAGNLSGKPELIFRSMDGKYPNAFALPGGYIVVSDELINLPVTDDELAAVLAHEMGHWQRRHGIQGLLRGSTALLVVSAVTGDLSTLSTFAGSIPFVILQRGYSREFETEADTFAIELLNRAHIDLANFQSVLEKLEDARPESGEDYTYLSTHPSNAERIRRINPTGIVRSIRPAPAKEVPAKDLAAAPKSEAADDDKPDLPDASPSAYEQVSPVYPDELISTRIEGSVTVQFVVDGSGKTRDASVLRSSDPRFETSALAAIAQWKFLPGRRQGKEVPMRVSLTIEFHPTVAPAPRAPAPKPPGDGNSSSDVPPVVPLE